MDNVGETELPMGLNADQSMPPLSVAVTVPGSQAASQAGRHEKATLRMRNFSFLENLFYKSKHNTVGPYSTHPHAYRANDNINSF